MDRQSGAGAILAERVIDEGHQVIECPLPALVCVTEGIAPEMYAGPEELEAAQEKPLEEVNCSQFSADPSQFGASGSPTWVQDIRLVEPARLAVMVEEESPAAAARQVAGLLRERLSALAGANSGAASLPASVRFPDSRDRSIWVVAETFQGGLRRVTLEMLGKARQLTSFTNSEVAAVLLGPTKRAFEPRTGRLGRGQGDCFGHCRPGPCLQRRGGPRRGRGYRRRPPLRRFVRFHGRRTGLSLPNSREIGLGAHRRRHRFGGG